MLHFMLSCAKYEHGLSTLQLTVVGILRAVVPPTSVIPFGALLMAEKLGVDVDEVAGWRGGQRGLGTVCVRAGSDPHVGQPQWPQRIHPSCAPQACPDPYA